MLFKKKYPKTAPATYTPAVRVYRINTQLSNDIEQTLQYLYTSAPAFYILHCYTFAQFVAAFQQLAATRPEPAKNVLLLLSARNHDVLRQFIFFLSKEGAANGL